MKKSDNHNLPAKLALRRHFLNKFHSGEPLQILDCCQGGGRLWAQLRREYPVATYWGVDLKPKKGRLKLDSVRILAQPGWPQTVIDVDTYGSPWKHWAALLPNIARPVTVFLTIGQVMMGTDRYILDSLGMGQLKVPPGIASKLHELALSYCLGRHLEHGLHIVEAMEALNPGGSARYVGVRVQPG